MQPVLAKRAPGDARPEEELDDAVRQITSRAVAPEGVVDIFAAAGLEKPDILKLREQAVQDLPDAAAFDLGWIPSAFIPRWLIPEATKRAFSAHCGPAAGSYSPP